MFDLAVDREARREEQGYVPSAQARAFLETSRQLQLKTDAMQPAEEVATAHPLHLIRTHMQIVFNDDAAYTKRREELTYIANTLIAGCAVQGRPFTTQEAADATCSRALGVMPGGSALHPRGGFVERKGCPYSSGHDPQRVQRG